MISPRTGSRARAPRCLRGAVALALGSALLVASPLAAAPASAATIEPDDGAVSVSLTTGQYGVMAPGGTLTTTVTITNTTSDELSGGRATIELNRTPLADDAALSAWLDDGTADGAFGPLGTEQTEAVQASESTSVSLVTSPSALGDLAEGVYPIRVSMAGASTGDVTATGATSVLIVSAASDAQISVLVPITATPAGGALLTADELTALTAPDGALTAQLDGVVGTAAVLAVDPLIPASIRALGTSAPMDAVVWLDRLESLSNERFALQAGDADAAVQADAGLEQPLTPLPLTSLLSEDDFDGADVDPTPSPTPTATPTESATPVPTEVVLPTDEELLAVPGDLGGIVWPVANVTTADLAVFDHYLSDAAAATVLPSTSIGSSTGALVDIDGEDVLVYDAEASAALSEAAAADDEAARERSIAEGLAALSFSTDENTLMIGLDRDETRSADALRQTILSVSALGRSAALTSLREGDVDSATLTGAEDDGRGAALTQLLDDEKSLTAFSSILDDPTLLLSPERLQLLRVIGVGAAEEYADAAAAHHTANLATLDAVGVQEPSAIQLFTAAAPLPVWVRNDLPWPVNVTLSAAPSDARLDVQPSAEVVAQPASNTRVKLPVEARVGSGELNVTFSLASPTGVHIGTDQTAAVTVRAEWERIGLGILGGLIALLLVLGIVRTVVRRRRGATKNDDAEDDADAGESDAGDDDAGEDGDAGEQDLNE